jgi:hypothetical protein
LIEIGSNFPVGFAVYDQLQNFKLPLTSVRDRARPSAQSAPTIADP